MKAKKEDQGSKGLWRGGESEEIRYNEKFRTRLAIDSQLLIQDKDKNEIVESLKKIKQMT